MRRTYFFWLPALCGMSLIQGCLVVKTPQVETVNSLVKSMFDKPLAEDDQQGNNWSARVGDEGRLVEVVEQDGFFVFVSIAGDAIAFDGWNIRSVIGFGDNNARQIAVKGEQKQFLSGSSASSMRCEDWKLDPDLSKQDSKVWMQECDSQVRANSIVVDKAGAISEISQVIDTGGNRAVLRPL